VIPHNDRRYVLPDFEVDQPKIRKGSTRWRDTPTEEECRRINADLFLFPSGEGRQVSRDATQVSGRPDGFERLAIDQAILTITTITIESFLRICRK